MSLSQKLHSLLVGQEHAVETITTYVEIYQAGLSDAERPAAVILLHGPTGCGKTRTVEALAAALHKNEKKLLRVDCTEYGLDHETAKLTGAPPGYLGHRETQPAINQQKLAAVTSNDSDLSLVLFDEIEKASSAFKRLLLGVLDKGTLSLGDNQRVSFAKSMVFMTSNIGAEEIARAAAGGIGLPGTERKGNLSEHTFRKAFPPEFLNRIDERILYHALEKDQLYAVLDLLLLDLQCRIIDKYNADGCVLNVTKNAKDFLIERGTSKVYGARELRRTVQSQLTKNLASIFLSSGSMKEKRMDVDATSTELVFDITDSTDDERLQKSIDFATWRQRKNAG